MVKKFANMVVLFQLIGIYNQQALWTLNHQSIKWKKKKKNRKVYIDKNET